MLGLQRWIVKRSQDLQMKQHTLHSIMNKIIIISFILIFGCNPSDKKQIITNNDRSDKGSKETVESEHYRKRPKSEYEITNGGIGILLIGSSFDSIEYMFNDNIVDTLTMSSEGIDWRAKRINLGNGEWILAEENTGDIITRIHTNSPRYRTFKGVHVGQKVKEILKSSENIVLEIDEGTMSIRLIDQAISISVDSISENKFYGSQSQELKDIPSNATVDEIGIY
jgi:hypothetical protein